MSLPLLQVALDEVTLEKAINSVKKYGHVIDIVEVGTILHVAEGARATSVLREMYPNKILLDDIKGADAGKTLAELCFGAGANTMTAICSADINTMIAMKKVGLTYGEDRDVQVELYGDWTFEEAQTWLDNGISQVVYHRSRDAELAGQKWGQSDIDKIAKLIEMGIKHRYTRPYRPQTNGKAERFWRTIEEDLFYETSFDSVEQIKDELLQYLVYYNHERPHQGINGKTPAEVAKNSPRIT